MAFERTLAAVLTALIVLLQYPLWVGKGGWITVWQYQSQLDASKAQNAQNSLRNNALAAEVADLKQGFDAIEERARSELGMIKKGERFVQVLDAPTTENGAKP